MEVTDIVHQRRRSREILSRNQDRRRSGIEGCVDVLDGDVEIKRRLISQNIRFADAGYLHQKRNEIQYGAMADSDPLRCSRAPAGEIDVQRVCVKKSVPDGCKGRLVRIRKRVQDVFKTELRAAYRKRCRLPCLCPAVKKNCRLQYGQCLLRSGRRLPYIHKAVKTAGVDCTEHCAECIHTLFHIKGHRTSPRDFARKEGADSPGASDEVCKSNLFIRINESNSGRLFCCHPLETVQYGCIPHDSSKDRSESDYSSASSVSSFFAKALETLAAPSVFRCSPPS